MLFYSLVHQIIGLKHWFESFPVLLFSFGAETARLPAPVNLDQALMRYEAELIYVHSH